MMIASPGTFEWALIQMKAGKAVRRKAWSLHVLSMRGEVVEFLYGPMPIRWLTAQSDILATDWELVEDDNGNE